MKRALHIHFWADIRNSTGSVEKVICALAANGREYEHLIACCVSGHNVKVRKFDTTPYVYHGIPVHPFIEDRWRNRIFNKILGLNAYTYSGLVELIHRLKPDVIHFHNRQNLVDATVRRLDYSPLVAVHYHNNFRAPSAPARADALLFPSSAAARHLQEKLGVTEKTRILRNPLTLELLDHAQSAGRPGTAASGSPPTILFGGGYQPLKAPDELLAAFAQLEAGSAKLILAGPYYERMTSSLPPGAEIAGRMAAPEFFALMARSDVVVMPSHDETFGLVALEAMFLRKLLVASDRGGLAEFVDPRCAIVVQPDDVGSIAAGLRRALAMLGTPQGREMIARAHERAVSYHPAQIATELEAIYQEIDNIRHGAPPRAHSPA